MMMLLTEMEKTKGTVKEGFIILSGHVTFQLSMRKPRRYIISSVSCVILEVRAGTELEKN